MSQWPIKFSFFFFLLFSISFGTQKYCKTCKGELTGQYLIHKGNNYHRSCYDKHVQIYCDHCNKKIEASYNTSKGKNYHKRCFQQHIQKRCNECGDLINGIYNVHESKEYHESCYIEFILPKCDICYQPVEDKYIKDFWGNYYHEYHDRKMPSCDNCNRLISKQLTKGGVSVSGNRFICNLCKPKVVNNKSQLKKNLTRVLRILQKIGIKDLPKRIPVTLVDSKSDLIKMSGHRHGNIQGYTNYEESILANKIIDQDYHIYILSNLHEEIFNAVLAHELLHVYLFQNQIDLKSDIREGFCNLGSNLIYENYSSKLSDYRLKNMNENSDPDYGIGFRKMKSMLDKIGWKRLLKKLPRM